MKNLKNDGQLISFTYLQGNLIIKWIIGIAVPEKNTQNSYY